MTTAQPESAGGQRADRAAHPARCPAAQAARGQRRHPGGRRLGDPGLRVEDQPDGAGPGRLQGARRRRPAHPLRRRRRAGARRAARPGPEANTPGWWHRYGDVLPTWFQSYLGLEAAAALIRTYEVQFVPGLLQTRDVRPRGRPARATAAPRRRRSTAGSTLRMTRQQLLTRAPSPPQLWAVVDEAALRRPIGGAGRDARADRSAHRGHQAAQRDGSRSSRSTPAATPPPAARSRILRFPDEELPDVVYIEQLTSALYLDKRDDVDHYAVGDGAAVRRGRAAGAYRRRCWRRSCGPWTPATGSRRPPDGCRAFGGSG